MLWMFKGLVMLVLKALNEVFLTSKAESFLKFFFFLPCDSRLGWIFKEERGRDRHQHYKLSKEASTERFPNWYLHMWQCSEKSQISCLNGVRSFPTELESARLSPWILEESSASSPLCYYSLYNRLLFLWCKILLLIDTTEP